MGELVVRCLLSRIDAVLDNMWIQKDQIVVLAANKVQGLVWPPTHCSHHDIFFPEQILYCWYVLLLYLSMP